MDMDLDKSVFGEIRQRPTYQEVLSSMRTAILSGRLKAGERIVEAQIAEQMSISRGPVREALLELEAEGLVLKRPYKGTYVATFSARDIREIYSLRGLLEGYAARLAACRVQPADIARLEGIVARMRETADAEELDTFVETDIEFHREICRLSHHQLLLQSWTNLVSRVRLFLTLADQVYFTTEHIIGTHLPTLEALRAGDPDLAEKTIKGPIIEVGETVARGVERDTNGQMEKDRVTELWENVLAGGGLEDVVGPENVETVESIDHS